MKHIVFAVCILVAPVAAAWAQDSHVRVIVGFNGAADDTVFANNGGQARKTLRSANAVSGTLPAGKIADVRAQANVSYVVENGVATTQQSHPQAKGKPSPPPANEGTLPWGIQRIGADLVWGLSKGTDVKVGVVDTGISQNHPDLSGNIGGAINIITLGNPEDDNGHGSHVAGTIAAVDHTNGTGVIGVAPAAKIYAAKVLNRRGSGTWDDVCKGIDWCVDQGVKVINLSLGGGDNPTLRDTVAAAIRDGVLVVAASGNEYASSPGYPAAYPDVLSVGAVSGTASRGNATTWASFSNKKPNLSAPGVGILSDWKGTGYNTISGTSMATPHVVGTAALVFGKNSALTWSAVRSHLISTVEDQGAAGYDDRFGEGLVDAQKAVNTAP